MTDISLKEKEIKKIKRNCYTKVGNLIVGMWCIFTIFLLISLGFKWMTPNEPPYLSSMVDIFKYFTTTVIAPLVIAEKGFKLFEDRYEFNKTYYSDKDREKHENKI